MAHQDKSSGNKTRQVRRKKPRSGADGGGGGSNGGGGKRGIPLKGWEKGDIVRDMAVQPDGPQIPRKPGSRRNRQTIQAKGSQPNTDSEPAKEPQEGQAK